MKDIVNFSLRMPVELNTELKKLAEKDMRSLNVYILKILQDHVQNQPK